MLHGPAELHGHLPVALAREGPGAGQLLQPLQHGAGGLVEDGAGVGVLRPEVVGELHGPVHARAFLLGLHELRDGHAHQVRRHGVVGAPDRGAAAVAQAPAMACSAFPIVASSKTMRTRCRVFW